MNPGLLATVDWAALNQAAGFPPHYLTVQKRSRPRQEAGAAACGSGQQLRHCNGDTAVSSPGNHGQQSVELLGGAHSSGVAHHQGKKAMLVQHQLLSKS